MSRPRPLRIDVTGLAVEIRGIEGEARAVLAALWAGFEAAAERPTWLRVEVEEAGRPASGRPGKDAGAELREGRARFRLGEGEADAGRDGSARVRVRPASPRAAAFAVHNLLLPCLAWDLPAAGRVLLHSAAAVLDGRAFLLAGGEGAGKSTWARGAEAGGAGVVTEDLAFVDATVGAAPRVMATAYRPWPTGPKGPGSWPLAAILFPRHGPRTAVEPCPTPSAVGRLAGAALYVGAAAAADPLVAGALDALAARVPCFHLTFREDGGFVESLRALPGDDGRGMAGPAAIRDNDP